jgi:hypothetical protein
MTKMLASCIRPWLKIMRKLSPTEVLHSIAVCFAEASAAATKSNGRIGLLPLSDLEVKPTADVHWAGRQNVIQPANH